MKCNDVIEQKHTFCTPIFTLVCMRRKTDLPKKKKKNLIDFEYLHFWSTWHVSCPLPFYPFSVFLTRLMGSCKMHHHIQILDPRQAVSAE